MSYMGSIKSSEVFGLNEAYSCITCGERAFWYSHPCTSLCSQGDAHRDHAAWCDVHVPRTCSSCNGSYESDDIWVQSPSNEWEPCVEIIRLDTEMTLVERF